MGSESRLKKLEHIRRWIYRSRRCTVLVFVMPMMGAVTTSIILTIVQKTILGKAVLGDNGVILVVNRRQNVWLKEYTTKKQNQISQNLLLVMNSFELRLGTLESPLTCRDGLFDNQYVLHTWTHSQARNGSREINKFTGAQLPRSIVGCKDLRCDKQGQRVMTSCTSLSLNCPVFGAHWVTDHPAELWPMWLHRIAKWSLLHICTFELLIALVRNHLSNCDFINLDIVRDGVGMTPEELEHRLMISNAC